MLQRHFNVLMEQVLGNLKGQRCFVYIDGIIIYSPNKEQHVKDLEAVFLTLHKANLMLNMEKCHFFKSSLKFLGHIVTKEGVSGDQETIRAIQSYPKPPNLKELQRFLGLAGWYHTFIPRFADLAAPLNNLKKKGVEWQWSDECQKSMDSLKVALQSSTVLVHPDHSM